MPMKAQKLIKGGLLVAIFIAALFFASVAEASASTYYVDTSLSSKGRGTISRPYSSSISAVHKALNDGDTEVTIKMCVDSGDGAHIAATSASSSSYVKLDDSSYLEDRLPDLTVIVEPATGCSAISGGGYISVDDDFDAVKIKNYTFEDDSYVHLVSYDTDYVIRGNTFEDDSYIGNYSGGTTSSSMSLKINANYFNTNARAINISDFENITIRNNDFDNPATYYYGIYLNEVSDFTIRNNDFDAVSIYVRDSDGGVLYDNYFNYFLAGSSYDAVVLYDSEVNIIAANAFTGTDEGIYVDDGSWVGDVYDNYFESQSGPVTGTKGMLVYGDVDDVTLNDFVGYDDGIWLIDSGSLSYSGNNYYGYGTRGIFVEEGTILGTSAQDEYESLEYGVLSYGEVQKFYYSSFNDVKYGVHSEGGYALEVIGSTFDTVEYGVVDYENDEPLAVGDSTFQDVTYCVLSQESDSWVEVYNNAFYNFKEGIVVEANKGGFEYEHGLDDDKPSDSGSETVYVEIWNNSFKNEEDQESIAIAGDDAWYVIITDNTFEKVREPIVFYDGRVEYVTGSTVTNSGVTSFTSDNPAVYLNDTDGGSSGDQTIFSDNVFHVDSGGTPVAVYKYVLYEEWTTIEASHNEFFATDTDIYFYHHGDSKLNENQFLGSPNGVISPGVSASCAGVNGFTLVANTFDNTDVCVQAKGYGYVTMNEFNGCSVGLDVELGNDIFDNVFNQVDSPIITTRDTGNIYDNEFYDAATAIDISASSVSSATNYIGAIYSNYFDGADYAIYVDGADSMGDIYGNSFVDVVDAIYIVDVSAIDSIYENDFGSGMDDGIYVENVDLMYYINSNVFDNVVSPVELQDVDTFVAAYDNYIDGADIGMYFYDIVFEAGVYQNVIVNSSDAAVKVETLDGGAAGDVYFSDNSFDNNYYDFWFYDWISSNGLYVVNNVFSQVDGVNTLYNFYADDTEFNNGIFGYNLFQVDAVEDVSNSVVYIAGDEYSAYGFGYDYDYPHSEDGWWDGGDDLGTDYNKYDWASDTYVSSYNLNPASFGVDTGIDHARYTLSTSGEGVDMGRYEVELTADSDGDGLWDEAESAWGSDSSVSDSDGDGIEDGDEIGVNTSPVVADSDGDSVDDGDEISNETDPLDASDFEFTDTDEDGLSDDAETEEYGTDPDDPDTDADGLLDGEEVNDYLTDPLLEDTDEDGLLDGEEVNDYSTDHFFYDTDFDGLLDGDDVLDYFTDPF